MTASNIAGALCWLIVIGIGIAGLVSSRRERNRDAETAARFAAGREALGRAEVPR